MQLCFNLGRSGRNIQGKVSKLEEMVYLKRGKINSLKEKPLQPPQSTLSLFHLPKGVNKKRLEKIQRDFLWGGGALDKKFHLVNWKTICSKKEKGGLGVKDLSLVNKALLGKWVSRFDEEESTIWKEVIIIKYLLEDGGWFTKTIRGNSGLGPWKEISKEIVLMKKNSMFTLGDGSRVRFWEDPWCGDQPLCDIFPRASKL